MRSFVNFCREFLAREDGPTAMEYALMLSLIAVVCIVAISFVGTSSNKTFKTISGTLKNATTPTLN